MMTLVDVLPHNAKAASVWDSAGRDYERVALHLADAIEHTVQRLDPRAGERVLDVATGTGLAARRAAARGTRVVGLDLGADLIDTARERAAAEGLGIEFRIGDAEQVPFEDSSFDRVISTFGIMFVSRPEAAAREVSRVCRRGGGVALASWLPTSSVARKFEMHRPYLSSSPASPSPFAWGIPERLRELLGGEFDLRFETGVTWLRLPSSEEAWDLFTRGYGPTRALAGSLPADRLEAFRRDFLAFYEGYRTELGIAVPREYLVAVGMRR
jgi:SAM-dependent methyltransferase